MAKHEVMHMSGSVLDAVVLLIQEQEGEGADAIVRVSGRYEPSVLWEEGGPIIERECIAVEPAEGGGWMAAAILGWDHETGVACADTWLPGETPLLAAMRAFVWSRFGDEVDLGDRPAA